MLGASLHHLSRFGWVPAPQKWKVGLGILIPWGWDGLWLLCWTPWALKSQRTGMGLAGFGWQGPPFASDAARVWGAWRTLLTNGSSAEWLCPARRMVRVAPRVPPNNLVLQRHCSSHQFQTLDRPMLGHTVSFSQNVSLLHLQTSSSSFQTYLCRKASPRLSGKSVMSTSLFLLKLSLSWPSNCAWLSLPR